MKNLHLDKVKLQVRLEEVWERLQRIVIRRAYNNEALQGSSEDHASRLEGDEVERKVLDHLERLATYLEAEEVIMEAHIRRMSKGK